MNKHFLYSILLVACVHFSFAQKNSTSKIEHVTVFVKGAQVERTADVKLSKGRNEIRLTGLSPYLNKESINIIGDGSFTILTVQHLKDYLHQNSKSDQIKTLEAKIDSLNLLKEETDVKITILNGKLDFLKANKSIAKASNNLTAERFNTLSAFYGDKFEKLNLEVLKQQRVLIALNVQIIQNKKQIRELNSNANLPSGTIVVTLEATTTKMAQLKFNYLVSNARWYPSYDVRFINEDQPLNLTYKANITQNTGVDWKNASLSLSTAQTDVSSKKPNLHPNYLSFSYLRAKGNSVEQALAGSVAGVKVGASQGSPGASDRIVIRGTSSLTDAASPLYVIDGFPMATFDIESIDKEDIETMEILKDNSATALYGSRGANGVIVISTKSGNGLNMATQVSTSKTAVARVYHIDAKQTILSDDKANTLVYKNGNIKATYRYEAVPKLSDKIYLVGEIANWQEHEFLDGAVNVYSMHSFIGKTAINTAQFKNKLSFSFGVENDVTIKREKLVKFSEKKFISGKIRENISYKISLRNNKDKALAIKITDQIPVSKTDQIEVKAIDISNAEFSETKGTLNWNVSLNPKKTKEIIVKYQVKYPADKKVVVE